MHNKLDKLRKHLGFLNEFVCAMLNCRKQAAGQNATKGRETSTIGKLLDERLIILDAQISSPEECILLMADKFNVCFIF